MTHITTLESISWFGRYGAPLRVSDPITFSIRFFENSGGKPAVSPLQQLDVAVNAVPTGLVFDGAPWFSYSTSLPALTFDPGTYWVSVLENDSETPTFGNSQWLWGDSSTTGIRAFRNMDGIAGGFNGGNGAGTIAPADSSTYGENGGGPGGGGGGADTGCLNDLKGPYCHMGGGGGGGGGGGALAITVCGNVSISGILEANGGEGSDGRNGGAGGTIVVLANQIDMSGSVEVLGGKSWSDGGPAGQPSNLGQGGDGVFYTEIIDCLPPVTVCGDEYCDPDEDYDSCPHDCPLGF